MPLPLRLAGARRLVLGAAVAAWMAAPQALPAEVLLEAAPVETRLAHLLPDHADEHLYHYVPKTPRVARWPDGKPKLTFLQYARTGKDVSGGLLHFLVTYGLTPDQLRETADELRQVDPEGDIRGPVPFVEGEFHIISATAGPNSAFTRRIVGTGKAPLLAGQEAAVSIALDEEGSTLLLKSFEKPTSDVSVQFVLTYEGLTPPFRALLTVDWDKVYEHRSFTRRVGAPFFRAEIREVYDELREEGAIELEVLGADEGMEALLASAYSTLTGMMFSARPIPPEDLGKSQAGGKPGWRERLFGGAHVGHYLRETRLSGSYRVDLRRRKRDRRQIPITGNLGDVYRRFSSDPEIFGFVDLDDPAFEERTVQVILDGEDLESFQEFVNFAGIQFRRHHDREGAVTEGTTFFDRKAFAAEGNRGAFHYLRKKDRSPGWLDYDYREVWSFRGGMEVQGDWAETSRSVLTLTPPYRYRDVEVLAEADNLAAHDVLRVAVTLRHRYRGMVREREVVLRAGEPLNALYSYLTERDDLTYEYRLSFLRRDGDTVEIPWTEASEPFLYAYYPDDAGGGRTGAGGAP